MSKIKTEDVKDVVVEVLKTAGGAVIARTALVMGNKALKVDQEQDPKKKKLKQVGIGLGVAAIGTIGAIKLPNEYKSFAAGFATIGVFGALTPFGKADEGFIPVLHGTGDYIEVNSELNGGAYNAEQEYLDEMQEEHDLNALAALNTDEGEEMVWIDEEKVNGLEDEQIGLN
jgi:hypothetical protein